MKDDKSHFTVFYKEQLPDDIDRIITKAVYQEIGKAITGDKFKQWVEEALKNMAEKLVRGALTHLLERDYGFSRDSIIARFRKCLDEDIQLEAMKMVSEELRGRIKLKVEEQEKPEEKR